MNDKQVIDYIQQGVERGLIKLSDDSKRIEYLEQKKSRLFSKPEEQVQTETYCRLILEYGYPKHRVQNFVPVKMGSDKIVTHIQHLIEQAQQLQTEAQQILADAKAEVERMILGDSGGEPCQPAG